MTEASNRASRRGGGGGRGGLPRADGGTFGDHSRGRQGRGSRRRRKASTARLASSETSGEADSRNGGGSDGGGDLGETTRDVGGASGEVGGGGGGGATRDGGGVGRLCKDVRVVDGLGSHVDHGDGDRVPRGRHVNERRKQALQVRGPLARRRDDPSRIGPGDELDGERHLLPATAGTP